jgi:hypothetical protein
MLNPINANTSHIHEATKPDAPKPQQPQQKSAPQPSDTVSLKSAGNGGSATR